MPEGVGAVGEMPHPGMRLEESELAREPGHGWEGNTPGHRQVA